MTRSPAAEKSPAASEVADSLHSAAIHLLRRLRIHDAALGLSGPRLSALSVIVFAGPVALGELAAAEQVRAPTMSRLVDAMQKQGLVTRETDHADARKTLIRATARGIRLLKEGRARRVAELSSRIATLPPAQIRCLHQSTSIIQSLLTDLAAPPRQH